MSAMRARTQAFAARFLPNGWLDVARQLLLFCGAYWLYRLARGLVDDRAAEAFANARDIVSLEQSLNLFIEPAVNAWASGTEWIADVTSWLYVNSHFTVTTLTLAFIYLWRNSAFYYVRNMFMAAMAMALIAYVLFPTAPPRFMPEWGFTDSVADFTGVQADSSNVLFNPFAAVPSMHVCFALMLGLPMARMVRRRWAATLWLAYPVVVSFVVVATANHWWMDAAAGAVVAAIAWCLATQLVRVQPGAWAFRTQPRVA
jgi:membrane-associated phospholipid phosphatase